MYGDLWAWAVEEPAKAAAAAVMVGIPVAGALAQQRQKDRARTGRSDASAPRRAEDAVLVRFLTGRDLKAGDPSSSASWWCAGEEVVRDRTVADLAAGPRMRSGRRSTRCCAPSRQGPDGGPVGRALPVPRFGWSFRRPWWRPGAAGGRWRPPGPVSCPPPGSRWR